MSHFVIFYTRPPMSLTKKWQILEVKSDKILFSHQIHEKEFIYTQWSENVKFSQFQK